MYYRYKNNSFKRFERGEKMREELYQKEIKDLTQDELYEILMNCGISSIKKVEFEQGGILFLDDLREEDAFDYKVIDKLDTLGNNSITYKISDDIEKYETYSTFINYKVA
ncbi:hypothetical protein CBG60_02955 [Fusobacterium animalis]|nr:hypothetical protein CBG60_02955 [Fusobacterium animalis]